MQTQRVRRQLDDEPQGHVARFLLVRHEGEVAGAGGADDGREAFRLLGQAVDLLLLVPADVVGHQPRGPHQLQPGPERSDHGQRQHAVDVEEHHHSRLVEGREDRLPDREARVRVGEGRGLGPHRDPGRDLRSVDLERVPL